MLKKLVALTLVALMVINPMTAFAVSWGSIVNTLYEQRSYNENGVDATVDDDGNVTVSAGTISDFYTDSRFKSYTFMGTVVLDGEVFEVHVGEADAVLVNIESGVGVQVDKVNISSDGGTATVNNSGTIETDEMFASTEANGGTVTVVNTADGVIVVEDEMGLVTSDEAGSEDASELNLVNAGELTVEHFWAWSHSGATITIENDGTITLDEGEHPLEDEGEEVKKILMMADGSGNLVLENSETGVINGQVEVSVGWEDETPDATGTIEVDNTGTITGDVNAWIHDEASSTVENSGTIDGGIHSYAHDDADTSVTNTENGSVTDSIHVETDNGTASLDNSGTVTGDAVSVGVNGNGTASLTNDGTIDVDEGTELHVNDGTGTFANTGDISGERFDLVASGNGTVTGTNAGSIDVEWGNVAAVENGSTSFTNESGGYIHTDENFDLSSGYWPGDEDYEGVDNSESSSVSFTNSGEIVASGCLSGNVFENGSITLENTSEGTITAERDGVHVHSHGNGEGESTVTVTNAGTVNSEWFNVGSSDDGKGSITNSGTVNGYMGAYADGTWDDDGNLIAPSNGGEVSITNSGTVTDGMGSYVNGTGISTVINTGNAGAVNAEADGEGASTSLTNSGTTNYVWVGANNGATGTAVNTGTVTGSMDNTAGNGGTTTSTNEGTVESMWSHADEGGNVSSVNEGTAGNQGGYSESEGSTVSVTNNGTVEGWLEGYMYGDGAAEVINNGDVGIKVSAVAGGEGSATAINTSEGTIGDGVQDEGNPPDGLWVFAENGGSAVGINDGIINGEIGGGANGEGSTTDVVNTENGSAETAWIDAHGGELALNNEGTVKGTLSVSIGTQSNAVTDESTVAELLEMTGIDISGYENTEIFTANPDGQLIARYSVDTDGKVVLDEVLMQGGSSDSDDPKFWTDERIAHHKEMERKAAAIGGVSASPYWVKQLYLGYMSLNLRLFAGEEQLLFKESLSWVPDTGAAAEKVLTLSVKTEDTSDLTMRLDGSVIDKLEQAGIVSINIVDGAGNLFMEYKTEDLKGAREMYGLTEKEYIVVGSADADVMKIAEDGTISPIEGETESAEEVAEEAKEPVEEAAEETPAA